MILIFLKWFDIDNQTLKARRPLYVNPEDKIEILTHHVRGMMDWTADVDVEFYDEIGPKWRSPIDRLVPSHTFLTENMQSGDIICFTIKT